MRKYNITRWAVALLGLATCFGFFDYGAMLTHPEWIETIRSTRRLSTKEAASVVPNSKLAYDPKANYGIETTKRIVHKRGVFGYSSETAPELTGDEVLFVDYPKP